MEYKVVREQILQTIKPTREETLAVKKAATSFEKDLAHALKQAKVKAQVYHGGSTAKGTFLKNAFDIDIFVRFITGEALSDELEEALELLDDDHERVHGSRDYFQLRRDGFSFEVVPVRKITKPKDAQNVTDMSPLHVEYVAKKLNTKLRDEIRITKQFCKANRMYGAESYIQGFSGHVIDLLILHYRSFSQLLEAAVDWPKKLIIDLEGHHKDPLRALNESKLHSPLILIDPVQPDRNAAAALSKEKYDLFIRLAQSFLENPSIEAFEKHPLCEEEITRRLQTGGLVILDLKPPLAKKDIAGAKCRKAYEYLLKQVRAHGFSVTQSDWEYDHDRGAALAYIHVAEKQLPLTYIQEGPPLRAKNDARNFKEKHSGRPIIEENGRLAVRVARKRRTLLSFLRQAVRDSPVTSRVHVIFRTPR